MNKKLKSIAVNKLIEIKGKAFVYKGLRYSMIVSLYF